METPGDFANKKQLAPYFVSELTGIYDEREARSIAYLVVENLTGKTQLQLFTEPDQDWGNDEKIRIIDILEKLKEGEPIQYLLGKTEFLGLELKLKPGVLIPRSETEELVDWVIKENRPGKENYSILDIGCGSGLLAHISDRNVYGVDINRTSLQNAVRNNGPFFCHGYSEELPFKSEHFDTVLTMEILEHVYDI